MATAKTLFKQFQAWETEQNARAQVRSPEVCVTKCELSAPQDRHSVAR